MKRYTHWLFILAIIVCSGAHATGNNWIDALSLSYGEDLDDNDTTLYRFGLQNKWERTWLNGGAWYVGGYWDAELSYLESDHKNSENDELFALGLTPVFRFQRDASLSSGVSPYAEIGVGPQLISETRLGRQKYSSALQIGSVLGFGLGFGDKGQYEISYRLQHISNGDIKTPNQGMNLHLLRLGYSFD